MAGAKGALIHLFGSPLAAAGILAIAPLSSTEGHEASVWEPRWLSLVPPLIPEWGSTAPL